MLVGCPWTPDNSNLFWLSLIVKVRDVTNRSQPFISISFVLSLERIITIGEFLWVSPLDGSEKRSVREKKGRMSALFCFYESLIKGSSSENKEIAIVLPLQTTHSGWPERHVELCRHPAEYCWFSNDVSKIQATKLSILPRLKTKWVLGLVIEYAWISKLLRDVAVTWRARELWCS